MTGVWLIDFIGSKRLFSAGVTESTNPLSKYLGLNGEVWFELVTVWGFETMNPTVDA